MEALRAVALASGLSEALKWGQPCYTLQGKNVAIIGAFKDYCALMFFKGALLKDPQGILRAPGQTQAGRQIRVTSLGEIAKLKPVMKAYLGEAMAVETAGLKVPLKRTADFAVPVEFKAAMAERPALKAAFAALTPGRQRAYLFHFAGAKQSQTRSARVAKAAPQIMAGKGLLD
jgi:uncharacterized protein YdeI (YjbR/CyaY-like superfamily)